jgi:hypothetical protein
MTHRPWKDNEKRPCRKCKELRGFAEFALDKRTKDGLSGFCRKCANRAATNWAKNNKSRVRQIRAEWRRRNPDAVRQETIQTRTKNPEGYRARYITNYAKRAGRIEQKPCQVCGEVNSQAHHPDYSKPLDVIWLCPEHHAQAHRDLRLMEERK